MTPYIVALALVVGAVGSWKVQDWRYAALDKQRIEQTAKETARRADKVDTAATGHEADKVRIEVRYRTITKEVTQIVKEPFYAAADAPACFDDAGLRQLAAATAASSPASIPEAAMPGLKPTGKWWTLGRTGVEP